MGPEFRTTLSNSDVFFSFFYLPVNTLSFGKVALSSDPVKHLGKYYFTSRFGFLEPKKKLNAMMFIHPPTRPTVHGILKYTLLGEGRTLL